MLDDSGAAPSMCVPDIITAFRTRTEGDSTVLTGERANGAKRRKQTMT